VERFGSRLLRVLSSPASATSTPPCRARGRARDDARRRPTARRASDSGRYSFITDVDCVVIDEVHLLDRKKRGAVLEVTVSRLRRLQDPRVVALSATMPNIADVAEGSTRPRRRPTSSATSTAPSTSKPA